MPAAPPREGERVPSYWGDLLREAEAEERARVALDAGRAPRDQHPSEPWEDDEVAAARECLRATREFDRFEVERLAQRDLTSANFVPAAGPPAYVAEAFCRSRPSAGRPGGSVAPVADAGGGRRR